MGRVKVNLGNCGFGKQDRKVVWRGRANIQNDEGIQGEASSPACVQGSSGYRRSPVLLKKLRFWVEQSRVEAKSCKCSAEQLAEKLELGPSGACMLDLW
jgi:hypothetical protein